MGYRGEDASRPHGTRGGKTPWQSSGTGPGVAGQWDDRSQGYPRDNYPQGGYPQGGYPQDSYPQGNGYPVADDGFGYGESDGYPGFEQQGPRQPGPEQPEYPQPGYGQPGRGQYDDQYGQHDGYGPQDGPDYGYQPSADTYGYPQADYGRPAPGYGPGGGTYPDENYQGQNYQDQDYQGQNGGYGQPGGYPAPRGGSAGYPALPAGQAGYPAADAGNDWYGGQPAAANGASFADTGSYALNGRIIDEYGTGPRGVVRDPVRGYPPGPDNAYQGTDYQGTDYQGAADYAGADYAGAGREEDAAADDPYQDGYSADGPYQDHYSDAPAPAPRTAERGRRSADKAGPARQSALGGKRMLLAALAVVVIGVLGAAAYIFLLGGKSAANNPNAQGPLPTSGAVPAQQAACALKLGTYCHIEARTDDPTPLTTAEIFPPAFTNEKDKTSYSLVSTKVDKTCSSAVIGQDLINALTAGKCTQVLRGSYVSGNGKIMGTIGVINLATTNEAHYAGKVVGQNDFVSPLTAAKGVASKLGNGTGVVQSEFKGHYLILTWSEFVNGTTPSTTAQNNQLEQFGNDLVAGTVNISLTERMVTGAVPTPGAG